MTGATAFTGTGGGGRAGRPQPVLEELGETTRRLERRGVTDAGQHGERRVVADRRRHAASEARVVGVATSCHDEHGHREVPQASGVELLGPRAEGTQRPGEAAGRVLPASGQPGRGPVEAGKKRCGQPRGEELVDRQPPGAGRLEASGERVVGLAARGARGAVLDPGVRADEDETPHRAGALVGRVEGDAAPHRVADVGRFSPGFGDEAPGVVQVPGTDLARRPVARQIDGEDLMVLGELCHDPSPGAPGLGEAVNEDDACPRADAFDGENSSRPGHGVAGTRRHRA
jgi:hypothetical protein